MKLALNVISLQTARVTYIAEELLRQLKARDWSAADASRASSIAEPKFSRWINGQQSFVADEDLEVLARTISKTEHDRAALLVARLRDTLRGPGARLVEIRLADEAVREMPAPYRVKLPPGVEADFEVLREHVLRDDDLRSILHGLAGLFREPASTNVEDNIPGDDKILKKALKLAGEPKV